MDAVAALVAFLGARLDEDEAAAKAAGPARALREVEAKRAIAEIHGADSDPCDAHDAWMRSISCDTLRYLVAVWSDHPDYRPEWKP